MNRTHIILAFMALGAIGIIGAVAVQHLNPEAQATFGNFIFTILGLATTAAVTIGGLKTVNDKVDQVQKQTNGRLTAKDEEIEKKDRMLLDNGIDPQTGLPFTPTTDVPTTPSEGYSI